MPVTKSVDEMLMGATVVREGTVYMRITSIGGDTVLSQIVRMIEDAQTSKPPVQVPPPPSRSGSVTHPRALVIGA